MIHTPHGLTMERPIHPLVDQVARGLKPGAYVPLYESYGDVGTCGELGLEALPAPIPGMPYEHGPEYAVAYPQLAADILTPDRLPRAEFLGRRRTEILRHIAQASIAEALVRLHAYPRSDPEYKMVGVPGRARPEVAWAQGALLGYNTCCIDYFLDTRYLGQLAHHDEIDLGYPRAAQRICCPECALRSAEVRSALAVPRIGDVAA